MQKIYLFLVIINCLFSNLTVCSQRTGSRNSNPPFQSSPYTYTQIPSQTQSSSAAQQQAKEEHEPQYPEMSRELYYSTVNSKDPASIGFMSFKETIGSSANEPQLKILQSNIREATCKPPPHKSLSMLAAEHNPAALAALFKNVERTTLHYKPKVDRQDANGETAMHWAIRKGPLKSVQILFEQGARLDIPDKTQDTFTALQLIDEMYRQYMLAINSNTKPHWQPCQGWPCFDHKYDWTTVVEKKKFFDEKLKRNQSAQEKAKNESKPTTHKRKFSSI